MKRLKQFFSTYLEILGRFKSTPMTELDIELLRETRRLELGISKTLTWTQEETMMYFIDSFEKIFSDRVEAGTLSDIVKNLKEQLSNRWEKIAEAETELFIQDCGRVHLMV